MSLPTTRVALTGALLGAALVPFFAASSANAATARESFSAGAAAAAACKSQPVSKAFAKIDGDQADYSIAPGGDFEVGSTAWSLSGGAKLVGGNESVGVLAGKRSLSLPLGGVATSPKFCVDETKPHFRFAYKVDSLAAGFVAKITYQSANGLKTMKLVSSQELRFMPSRWGASPKSPLATLIPLNGGSTTVQIQLIGANFTGTTSLVGLLSGGNLGLPTSTIDSVMVDPYRRS